MHVCLVQSALALPLQSFKGDFYVHVVLATLYQERIVKMKDLKDLTAAAWPWSHCICIQCTNSPNVVTKTAELLAKVGRDEEANLLKGQ